MDPDKTQRIPVSIGIVAILIVEDGVAEDQKTMTQAIAKTLMASLTRIPYIASVEAIRVVEVEPTIQTRRTQ
jgi:hypothetical protein